MKTALLNDEQLSKKQAIIFKAFYKLSALVCLCALSACATTAPTPSILSTPTLTMGKSTTLIIDKGRFVCDSTRPMQCMTAIDEQGRRHILAYNAIDGFVPDDFQYKIVVRPWIDDSTSYQTGRYVLDEILSQNP